MKVLLCMALVAMMSASANAACTEVDNCDTCSNPAALCTSCPTGTIISSDKKKCLSCGTGCETCTADDKDKVTCTKCLKAYYLDKGACTACDTGCGDCVLGTDGKTVSCKSCMEKYGTKTDSKTSAISCIACSSNCKACTVNTDDSTKCTSCYSYKGLAKQGYFLKKADSSCGACPTSCEQCTDDGNGVGICKSCYKGYNALDDTSDDTKDGTSCLKCPSNCATCSGVKTGSDATCTACTADKGLYVSSGTCITCGTGAKTCTDKGVISSCLEEYRQDGTSCVKCPANCKQCSLDSNNAVVCGTCAAKFAPKPTKSVTCDSCGIANVLTCTRASDGTGKIKVSACKKGYAKKSDTECAACGGDCKSGETCTYNSGTSKFVCTVCSSSTMIDNPSSNSGACPLCSTSPGGSDCSKCTYDTGTSKVKCTECTFPKLLNSTDGTCVANIDTQNTKCIQANNDATACAKCADNYGYNGAKCDACVDSNSKCLNCNGDKNKCEKCATGYITSNSDKSGGCVTCGTKISNCGSCSYSGSNAQCSTCDGTYLPKTDKSKCIANPDTTNSKCTKMATNSETNCATCAEGYVLQTDNKKCSKCNDAQCKTCSIETGSEKKCTTCNAKYITTSAAGGECKACPTQCKVCTYDTATSKTKCTTNQCESKYTNNPDGTCEACSDNCDACTYDSTNKKTECTNCATGYGLLKAKTCSACPANCNTCSTDSSGDDILYCDTCANEYVKNPDVCGGCPSNCNTCANNKGTMECSKCDDFYALNTKKACVKCPSNCNKCTAGASGTKCSECKIGYSLSADATACTACDTAAFTGCANCTATDAVSGKANCTACASGYTLQDEKEHLSCVDVSGLQCGAGVYGDSGPQCSACSATYTLTKSLACGRKCYSCGDVNTGVYVEKSKCTIPAAGANATADDAKEIDCLSGICYAAYQDGKVAAGCLPKGDATGVCTGDRAAGETCQSVASKQKCERCCSEGKCNSFVADMDGVPDSAITTAVNMVLLVLASMLAIRFN